MSRAFIAVGGTGQHVGLALADYLVLTHSVFDTAPTPTRFFVLDADCSGVVGDASPEKRSAWELASEQVQLLNEVPDRDAAFEPCMAFDPLPPTDYANAGPLLAALYPGDRDLPNLLLSSSQQGIDVSNGYHGEPRVASAVSAYLLERAVNQVPLFRHLSRILEAQGARVCVAGSAVGGTGAGVLPRLLPWLQTAAAGRQVHICGLVALRWFGLQKKMPDQQGPDDVVMERNGDACAWHYFGDTAPDYRLVLWGDPKTGGKDTMVATHNQAAKVNLLTQPTYAAASAATFLYTSNTQHLENGNYTPVTLRYDLRIARLMPIDVGATLGEAAARSRALVEAWRLVLAYKDAPKSFRPPFRGDTAQVEELDRLLADTTMWAEVERSMNKICEAKVRALDRLANSEQGFPGTASALVRGIPRLKKLFKGLAVEHAKDFAHVFARAIRTETATVAEFVGSNRGFILDISSEESNNLGNELPGQFHRLGVGLLKALRKLPVVECSRIPDTRGIERALLEAFDRAHDIVTWESTEQHSMVATMLDGGDSRLPVDLGAARADRMDQWARRWFLCVRALLSATDGNEGVAIVRDVGNQGGILVAQHSKLRKKLRLPARSGGAALAPGTTPETGPLLGYLSDELLVAPCPGAFWEIGGGATTLRADLPALSMTVAPWVIALYRVVACKFGPGGVPTWLRALNEVCAHVPGVLTSIKSARGAAVHVKLGDTVYAIPRPANPMRPDDTTGKSLVEAMGEAVALPVELAPTQGTGAGAEVDETIMGIRNLEVRDVLCRPKTDVAWSHMVKGSVVWKDLLQGQAGRHFADGLLLVPGAGKAYRLPSDGLPLRESDIFLPKLTVLLGAAKAVEGQPGGNKPLVVWPLRSEFLGLLDVLPEDKSKGEPACLVKVVAQGERDYLVTFRLKGRPTPSTRHYEGKQQVDLVKVAAVYVAPKRPASGTSAIASIVREVEHTHLSHRLVFTNGKEGSFSTLIRSPWQDPAIRMAYVEPKVGNVASGMRLRYLELNDGQEGVGVVPLTDLDPRPPRAGVKETWCMDFGSSSTVVARAWTLPGQKRDVTLVYPRENHDPTLVVLEGIAARKGRGIAPRRADFNWIVTRDCGREVGVIAKMMPSQIVNDLLEENRDITESYASFEARYGKDFQLDSGALGGSDSDERKTFEDWLKKKLIRDIKWAKAPEGLFRRRFIHHLLELACWVESQQGNGLPSDIDVIFTLPLRQLGDVDRFVAEVKEVCGQIRDSVGLASVKPLYQWESLALAPDRDLDPTGDQVHLVADLGGGTLDLFARHFQKGKEKNTAVESVHVGGNSLVEMLAELQALRNVVSNDGVEAPEHTLAAYGRYLCNESFNQGAVGTMTSNANVQFGGVTVNVVTTYFDIIHKLIALWASALAEYWGLEGEATFKLQLAGLGWSLPGGPRDAERAATEVTKAIKDAHLNLGTKMVECVASTEQFGNGSAEERKLNLAQACARRVDAVDTPEALKKMAHACDRVLGVELLLSGGNPMNYSVHFDQCGLTAGDRAVVNGKWCTWLFSGLDNERQRELSRLFGRDYNAGDDEDLRGALHLEGLMFSPLAATCEKALEALKAAARAAAPRSAQGNP